MPTTSTTLARLASHRPAAIEVLLRYGLDFWCRGGDDFADACGARGLDPARVLAEIPSGPDETSWLERPLADLVAHIFERYHRPLRPALDDLVRLTEAAADRHGADAAFPSGLLAGIHFLRASILDHLQQEEHVVFPLLAAGEGRAAAMASQSMAQEHDDQIRIVTDIRRATGDLTAPSHACRTWRRLYDRLEVFERELFVHLHLENNILFPRALLE